MAEVAPISDMRTTIWMLLGLASMGCGHPPVGQPCSDLHGSVVGILINPGADECPSQLCLIQPSGGACTAWCDSDGDCVAAAGQKSCRSGFACAVAMTVGTFACEKACLCRDDLVDGVNRDSLTGHAMTPAVCQR